MESLVFFSHDIYCIKLKLYVISEYFHVIVIKHVKIIHICYIYEMICNISMTSLNFRTISIHSINHDQIKL